MSVSPSQFPAFWWPMLAVWSGRLGIWHLYDRYHRVPLQAIPCRTLEAVFRVAADQVQTYITNPIVDARGNWVDAAECVNPEFSRCVHGLKAPVGSAARSRSNEH